MRSRLGERCALPWPCRQCGNTLDDTSRGALRVFSVLARCAFPHHSRYCMLEMSNILCCYVNFGASNESLRNHQALPAFR